MCGIFAYTGNKNNAAQLVLQGLKTLEYRGYDSWGIAVAPSVSSLSTHVKKQAGKIGAATVTDVPASSCGFGHTRWATHGGVTDINAHPHMDCTGVIALVHNGIIENYDKLKQALVKKKHRFVSETDSEVAAHLIEEYAKKNTLQEAVQKAFNEMDGSNAIVVMDSYKHEFYAVRNGSPLVIGFGKGKNYLASDAAALLPHTRRVHFMKDDEMAVVSKNTVYMYNVRTGEEIKPVIQTLEWKMEEVQKGKYPYYMLKEIYEQNNIITDIAANMTGSAKQLAQHIVSSYGTYLVGCGTASYACIAGTYLFSKIAKRHINWAVASEFEYQLDFLVKKSLVIAISQSGETMDTLDVIKKAKFKGALTGALVNVFGSTLQREADIPVLLGAGVEKGVASTKAFTAMLTHLILAAYAVAGNIKKGQVVLSQAARSTYEVLERSADNIKKLAHQIRESKNMYVIGRGLSYPASLEAALKIKEISYIHAEGFAAGELKHGVLALIEKGTPCMVYAPQDETYAASINGAMEMKARGGYIIGFTSKPHEVFDYCINVPDAHEATIIPNVVAAQLLAYYLTLERGLDPDMPRNLAKSVTVK